MLKRRHPLDRTLHRELALGPRLCSSWVTVGVTVGSALLGKSESDKQKKKGGALSVQQEAEEALRQKRIDETQGLINSTFDSSQRSKQYEDYGTALREYRGSELVRQKRDAARNLKFALAKAGQTGGSQAVDAGGRLGDEFQRGALGNEREVQGAVADLKNQDELSRQSLLGMAESGLDLTSALRRSSAQLQSNLGNANLNTMQKGLGDVFTGTAATYKAINERVAQRRGFGYKTNRSELYG